MTARNQNAGLQRIDAGTNFQLSSIKTQTRDQGWYLQGDVLTLEDKLLSLFVSPRDATVCSRLLLN